MSENLHNDCHLPARDNDEISTETGDVDTCL